MQFLMTLFVALLFFCQTPGLFFTLSKSGNKYVIAAAHAVLFAISYALVNIAVNKFFSGDEGFQAVKKKKKRSAVLAEAAAAAAAEEEEEEGDEPMLNGKPVSLIKGGVMWGGKVCMCAK
jgi:hypothetical protein